MMTYTIAFSMLTGKSAVHADGCSSATKRQGMIMTTLDAVSAKAAAAQYAIENDLVALDRPTPTVCRCAR